MRPSRAAVIVLGPLSVRQGSMPDRERVSPPIADDPACSRRVPWKNAGDTARIQQDRVRRVMRRPLADERHSASWWLSWSSNCSARKASGLETTNGSWSRFRLAVRNKRSSVDRNASHFDWIAAERCIASSGLKPSDINPSVCWRSGVDPTSSAIEIIVNAFSRRSSSIVWLSSARSTALAIQVSFSCSTMERTDRTASASMRFLSIDESSNGRQTQQASR